jgi:hypothetical protein
LSARHLPVVERTGVRSEADDPGYRDALCQSAGATLLEGYATVEHIVLRLDDGTTLALSMHDETDGVAPEVAELIGEDGMWFFGPEFN